MIRHVRYASLHQTVFVPGTGNLTNTLEPSKQPGIQMLYTTDGLLVEYKGVSFVVPLANVSCAVFSEGKVIDWAQNNSSPTLVKPRVA